ncbi:hypothetical protein OE699_11665 [Sedimentimonas flavescens]|uniref:Type IV pilus biogenesis protein PilP n=1 Tax=Sedimentimonas flavescens TaxID=2851012 RepID=A0ABT3A0I0_9RHOB|nr:hypothetical protein [Sedimentimonas flavescens]MCV2879507.1 hypothetical protein [Sedimentimonas flavescens]
MKPSFALNLSLDGIGLLHRRADGWARLGEVSLEVDDLQGALTGLRRAALSAEPRGLTSKLIIPASQILYTEVRAPGPRTAQRRSQIAAALEGMTPYPVEDLIFDWSGNGETVQVAIVARETLAEAEAFAESHGFCPISFVALPEPGQFGGEPWFGLTANAAQHLPEGARVDRDQDPVRVVEQVSLEEFLAATEEPVVEPAPEPIAEEALPEVSAAPPSEPEPPAESPAPEPEGADDEEALTDLELALNAPFVPDLPPAEEASPQELSLAEEPLEPAVPDTPQAELEPQESPEQPQEPEAPVPAFSSRRTPELAARADDAGVTPRLGGAARLHPMPPRTMPPEQKAKLMQSGSAGVTAPGLALPETDLRSAAETLKRAAKAGLDKAARGTAKLGDSAGKALVKSLKPKLDDEPATAPEEAEPAASPFGTFQPALTGGKPRHFGLKLTAGLVLFLGIVALWSSFLGDDTPPAEVAALETQAPAPASEITAPAAQPAPEPAATETAAPPPATEQAAAEPAPAVPQPAEPTRSSPEIVPAPNLSLSSISTADPALRDTTATATLPPAESLTDSQPVMPPPPPPFEQLARLTPEGDIQPTPQGVVMPGDFTLYAGKPPRQPGPRPEAIAAAALVAAAAPAAPTEAEEPAPYADPALAGLRPKPRPAAIEAAAQAAAQEAAPEPAPEASAPETDDGAALTPEQSTRLALLANAKPKARPASIASAFATASAAEEAAAAEAARAAEAQTAALASATARAVSVSRRPPAKPRNFTTSVENALAAAIAAEPAPAATQVAAAPARQTAIEPPPEELDEPEPVSVAPKLPTSASVAKQATLKNAIDLKEINLIGVYGSSSNRRALVRLSSGKYVKVSVGDRLDGGKVTAIGAGQLTYKKGSRNYTLTLLKGS